ncbi:MAG TPA: DUF742 domain-containing protein [Pseudonocardiaceae bacterium]|jgi:hypothetical protein
MSSADDPRYGGIDPDVSLLRPYLLTSGRTQPVDQTLEVEAQVLTSQLGAAAHDSLAFERRDIVELCRVTMSVAEVAAILGLHIGVARILVADLAELGYVIVRRPATQLNQDIDMIERVIRGLEAIS